MENLSTTIGENVKDLRVSLGMSQQELAEKVGAGQPFISQVENGTRRPSLAVALRIANVLGVSVANLIAREGDKVAV